MRAHEMDLTSGMREGVLELPPEQEREDGSPVLDGKNKSWGQKVKEAPVTVWKAFI